MQKIRGRCSILGIVAADVVNAIFSYTVSVILQVTGSGVPTAQLAPSPGHNGP